MVVVEDVCKVETCCWCCEMTVCCVFHRLCCGYGEGLVFVHTLLVIWFTCVGFVKLLCIKVHIQAMPIHSI